MENFFSETYLADKFICIRFTNNEKTVKQIDKHLKSRFIQFHFILKNTVEFMFNDGNYTLEISKNKFLILFNPNQELPISIKAKPNASVVTLLITIDEFHKLFYNEHQEIPFLKKENINKKYYKEHPMDDTMLLVLNQIIKYNVDSSTKELYLKGKVYQLFSLLFDSNSSQPNTTCPYMMNDNNLKKINLAKEIIINEYSCPPTLLELSSRVDLSLRRLKEGFKEIYGKPVFQFLLEYKMAMAKRFLIEEDYNINEVSIKLGYSTASHFISSFKKRYGVTPKVYVKNFYKN